MLMFVNTRRCLARLPSSIIGCTNDWLFPYKLLNIIYLLIENWAFVHCVGKDLVSGEPPLHVELLGA